MTWNDHLLGRSDRSIWTFRSILRSRQHEEDSRWDDCLLQGLHWFSWSCFLRIRSHGKVIPWNVRLDWESQSKPLFALVLFSWSFVYFLYGKSPFLTTICVICLQFFPTKQANLRRPLIFPWLCGCTTTSLRPLNEGWISYIVWDIGEELIHVMERNYKVGRFFPVKPIFKVIYRGYLVLLILVGWFWYRVRDDSNYPT